MTDILSALVSLVSISIEGLLIFVALFYIVYIIVAEILSLSSKKLSTLFQSLVGFNYIHQNSSIYSRRTIKKKRNECDDKFLRMKMQYMSSFLISEFEKAFSNLDIGKKYTTKTHIKSILLRAEKQDSIIIHTIKPYRKRYLYEAIALLGIFDYLKIRCSYRKKMLYKQFYKITFTRIK